jgi:hypothetical protein
MAIWSVIQSMGKRLTPQAGARGQAHNFALDAVSAWAMRFSEAVGHGAGNVDDVQEEEGRIQ